MKVNNGTEHQTRITRENWKKGVECLLFYWPEFSARNAYLETVAVPFDPETKKPFEPVYVMRGVDFWPPRVFNEGSKMRDMTWDHDV